MFTCCMCKYVYMVTKYVCMPRTITPKTVLTFERFYYWGKVLVRLIQIVLFNRQKTKAQFSRTMQWHVTIISFASLPYFICITHYGCLYSRQNHSASNPSKINARLILQRDPVKIFHNPVKSCMFVQWLECNAPVLVSFHSQINVDPIHWYTVPFYYSNKANTILY